MNVNPCADHWSMWLVGGVAINAHSLSQRLRAIRLDETVHVHAAWHRYYARIIKMGTDVIRHFASGFIAIRQDYYFVVGLEAELPPGHPLVGSGYTNRWQCRQRG